MPTGLCAEDSGPGTLHCCGGEYKNICTTYFEMMDVCCSQCVNNMVSAGKGSELKPALGLAWSPVPNHRLELRLWHGQPAPQNLSLLEDHEKKQLRTATLTKSSRQASQ